MNKEKLQTKLKYAEKSERDYLFGLGEIRKDIKNIKKELEE